MAMISTCEQGASPTDLVAWSQPASPEVELGDGTRSLTARRRRGYPSRGNGQRLGPTPCSNVPVENGPAFAAVLALGQHLCSDGPIAVRPGCGKPVGSPWRHCKVSTQRSHQLRYC